jgi:hypothetical protein
VEARKDAKTEHATADDYGAFTFPDLDAGDWAFVALDAEDVAGKTKRLKVPDQTDAGVWLQVARRADEQDARAGRLFFYALLAALALLVILYVALHVAFPQAPEPLSETIPVAITAFEEEVAVAFDAEDKDAAGAGLLAALADIEADVKSAMDQRKDMSETDQLLVQARIKTVQDSLTPEMLAETLGNAESSSLPSRIDVLRQIVAAPRQSEVGIWERDPLRIIEVLLWGLAGILVNKIMITGWWLYQRRFYKDGIVMHVAHLVATPIMVLVLVFLLSLVSLSITLASGNALTLDLSDPRVMVAFSFLMGTIPWPLYNFIESTAKRFPEGIS